MTTITYPSTNARERGWGDPDSSGYSKNMVRIVPDLPGIPLYVHKRVAWRFEGFIRDMRAHGYHLSSSGGYNNRDVRGHPGVKSNHAWGLAADFNAGTNPLGSTKGDMPAYTHDVANKWGLYWGGDYKTRKDKMHDEFVGTPTQASDKVYPHGSTPVVSYKAAGANVAETLPVLKRGNTGFYVRIASNALRINGYGTGHRTFGPLMQASVKKFQSHHRLKPDGVIGPVTWGYLLRLH